MRVGKLVPPPSFFHWLGLGLITLALPMVAIVVWFARNSYILETSGERGTATVVGMTMTGKGAGKPTFEMTTRTGQRVRWNGNKTTYPPAYTIGQQVPALYLPADPDGATVESFDEMWSVPAAMGAGALLVIVLGSIFTWVSLRRMWRRGRLLRRGLRIPGTVVEAIATRTKAEVFYEPFVEFRNPATGDTVRRRGDPTAHPPAVGAAVTVHIDPSPPHDYFVPSVPSGP